MVGELLSIQVGKVKKLVMPTNVRVDFRHPFWTSAIYKSTVEGPVRVYTESMEGDEQSDHDHHGGKDNVILAYDADHYPVWREELGMPELGHGAFGENFSVRGFSDATVCVGDVWRVGEGLVVQVTQARQPCFKLARRLCQPHIVKRVRENSWGGWYLRVLEEGMAEAGMKIEMVERRQPAWTVERAVQTIYARKKDRTAAEELAALPELSARWKEELLEE
jgi:MOSC domain-containing protein YiiM